MNCLNNFTTLSKDEIEKIHSEHMINDFPKDELKSLNHISRLTDEKKYTNKCLFSEENELMAYAFFGYPKENSLCPLLDFFAVNSKYRNQGIGSKFLNMLKSESSIFKNGILAEIEDPNSAKNEEEKEIRLKRAEFYKKNGFITTNIKSTCFGVSFLIIYLPKENYLSEDELQKNLINAYKALFSKSDFEKNIKVTK